MSRRIETPFDSIENSQQYIRLLAETVAEAKRDINEIILSAPRMSKRRLQALRVVEYNLEKLQRYLSSSRRTLNDLRSLRRLLHGERPAAHGAGNQQEVKTASLITTISEPLRAAAGESAGRSQIPSSLQRDGVKTAELKAPVSRITGRAV
jgi:ABC-type transporter Mla subunit MlaD